jgi:hypothetical protein
MNNADILYGEITAAVQSNVFCLPAYSETQVLTHETTTRPIALYGCSGAIPRQQLILKVFVDEVLRRRY